MKKLSAYTNKRNFNAGLGTSAGMNPKIHELLWWSAGADPYVSLDQNPVQINSMPLNWGYPLMNSYPTGQTGDWV